MFQKLASLALLAIVSPLGLAQSQVQKESEPAEHGVIREKLKSYVEAFNRHDATTVGTYWAANGVSIVEDNGERTTGREALVKHFAEFFQVNPGARLTGEILHMQSVRPDVVAIGGRTTLFLPDEDPVESAFSAILLKEGDQWLISNSTEHDLPKPTTPHDALKELEWMVGAWEDQSEAAMVQTTVRWTANKTFLIRGFTARFGEGDEFEGTQVIGWDPRNEQIRTWTFNSDGGFSEGTMSKNGADWMVKISQTLSDGKLSSATQVISRVNEDTITVQTVGQTVEGIPVPASEPVTVVRIPNEEAATATEPAGKEGAAK